MLSKVITYILLLGVSITSFSQTVIRIFDENQEPIQYAKVFSSKCSFGAYSNENGEVTVSTDTCLYTIQNVGYFSKKLEINGSHEDIIIKLDPIDSSLDEFVVSGNLKGVLKRESPLPIEVYAKDYLNKVPSPSLFEATQNINGVRPQINCAVCNTGDIHINGMEGPYTMVTIDGMPIVGGLSTVYGLQGIPSSLLDRVEVVKGPASTLYGSEAVGGLINIITKNPQDADLFNLNYNLSSWMEHQIDGYTSIKGKKVSSLLSFDAHWYDKPIDNNEDNFTDLILKKRVSLMNKLSFNRKEGRLGELMTRYFYEDRWGGEMQWRQGVHRGGNEVYGESIFTNRVELIGKYQLPVKPEIVLKGSYSYHDQNSVYGEMHYDAIQQIGFLQMDHELIKNKRNNLLVGLASRYTFYDDNTTATENLDDTIVTNAPSVQFISGGFAQHEWKINEKHTTLTGLRLDYHNVHGEIFSPRFSYKFDNLKHTQFRLSYGNGFRVVNVFTEDHAALTGARDVIIASQLNPERTHNVNLNWVQNFNIPGGFLTLDGSVFYTYFDNKILPDYDSDDNLIIYDNLDGFGVSKGVSLNAKLIFEIPLRVNFGATLMDVYTEENGIREQQILTENYSGTWNASYTFSKMNLTLDYTGSLYGPMRLPILENDFRSEYSETYSIQNLKISWKVKENVQLYAGVRNLLNFMPPAYSIMRSFDPFDTTADDPISNPNGYTFDPAYVYASFQGINGFVGFNVKIP